MFKLFYFHCSPSTNIAMIRPTETSPDVVLLQGLCPGATETEIQNALSTSFGNVNEAAEHLLSGDIVNLSRKKLSLKNMIEQYKENIHTFVTIIFGNLASNNRKPFKFNSCYTSGTPLWLYLVIVME